ncbi:response regulator transcription factor [Limimaricola variabilis]
MEMPPTDMPPRDDTADYILSLTAMTDPERLWRGHHARMAAHGIDRICYAALPDLDPDTLTPREGMLLCADPCGCSLRPLGIDDTEIARWVIGEMHAPPCQPGPAHTLRFGEAGARWRGAIALGRGDGTAASPPHAAVQAENAVFHLRLTSLPGRCIQLTPRQVEVLDLVALGYTTREVAERLNLTPTTVEKHLRLAREALGARNTTHAVFRAAQLGGVLDQKDR